MKRLTFQTVQLWAKSHRISVLKTNRDKMHYEISAGNDPCYYSGIRCRDLVTTVEEVTSLAKEKGTWCENFPTPFSILCQKV